MTHIIRDIVIFSDGVTSCSCVIIYSASIFIYSTISNCEIFSIIEVNTIIAIASNIDIF